MDTQNFPDMADAASGAKNTDSSASGAAKINNVNMFSGVYANRGPRTEQSGEENKAGPTKPVFKGKGKFKTGGDASEETANPRMNYDFSKMRMSAAKSGGGNREGRDDENRGEGGNNERRRGGPKQGMQASNSRTFGDDDDFEVVTDKKKGAGFRRNNF